MVAIESDPMDEAISEGAVSEGVPDQDITKVSDSTAPRPAGAVPSEDLLPTEHVPAVARLPPISLPPLRPPSAPPPPVAVAPSPPPAQMPTLPPRNPPIFDAARDGRSSAPSAEEEAMGTRRAMAVGCVVAACALATIALIFAFRPPPPEGAMSPLQAASVVLSNAILAIGAGAFGYGLLRIAERLSAPEPPG